MRISRKDIKQKLKISQLFTLNSIEFKKRSKNKLSLFRLKEESQKLHFLKNSELKLLENQS
jgi:hypothetical protein